MGSHSTHTNVDPVLAQAVEWLDRGRRIALATVTRTWGSAPRRAGSHMVISHGGDFAGSVSGGCIEGAVIGSALEAIESGTPRTLEFGVTNEMAWEVGLACGGRVHLFVEPVANGGVLRELVAAQDAGRDLVLATRLPGGEQELVDADAPSLRLLAREDAKAGAAVADALKTGVARTVATGEGDLFLRPYIRSPRLIVVGAVHIAQALVPMAAIAGFQVTVLDPREGFATEERFPGARLVREWPDDAMAALDPDRRTAIVALSHDPRIDDPALIAALGSEAFYVGALGSRKTRDARRERLGAQGNSDESLDRIHGPVGLPIGALTPEEIAVAVLAQVIEALRGPSRA